MTLPEFVTQPWVQFLFAAGLTDLVIDAISSGSVWSVFSRTVRRSERPVEFWVSVAVTAVGSIMVAAYGLAHLPVAR